MLQWLALTSRLLLRGAISIGRHCPQLGFMFSQGLVAAYRLESGTARYPRVLVDVNLIELMKNHGPNDQVAELLGWECASHVDGGTSLYFFEPGKIDEFWEPV